MGAIVPHNFTIPKKQCWFKCTLHRKMIQLFSLPLEPQYLVQMDDMLRCLQHTDQLFTKHGKSCKSFYIVYIKTNIVLLAVIFLKFTKLLWVIAPICRHVELPSFHADTLSGFFLKEQTWPISFMAITISIHKKLIHFKNTRIYL